MIKKIYTFLCEYELFIKFILLVLAFVLVLFYIYYIYQKDLKREINIIENLRDYAVFDYCKKLENQYYCWNDEK